MVVALYAKMSFLCLLNVLRSGGNVNILKHFPLEYVAAQMFTTCQQGDNVSKKNILFCVSFF